MAADPSIIAFQQACGCNGELLVETADADCATVEQKSLTTPFAVIGREQACDLHVVHDEVSRRHAFLQILGGRVFCFDLDSRTGTRWNDGRRFSGWVVPGDAIHIGPYRLRAHCDRDLTATARDDAWDPLQARSIEILHVPPVTLEFLNGATRNRCWQIDRVLTIIGSAPGCKVRVRSRSVGRFHCYLVATPNGVWAVDLVSAAGLLLNGEPVRYARLEDGDQLLIGGFLIRSHHGEFKATTPSKPMLSAQNHAATAQRASAPPIPHVQPMEEGTVSSALAVRLPAHGEMTRPDDERFLFVMNQFSQMQMQMFDQFQQTMMMMFQMFGTLQQEQIAVLRDELDQVRELTRELQALQESLAKAEQSPPAEQTTSGYHMATTVTEFVPASYEEPEATSRAAALSKGNGDGPAATAGPASKPAAKSTKPAGSKSPGDLHTLLLQRMETIEQERQNRWQKILGLLGGKK
ncbi:MAG TPA: FHA domain-containing protein [Gemmataceae bacterium]|nr:FHA domain-containing protein [Gemmataceae bacterium]